VFALLRRDQRSRNGAVSLVPRRIGPCRRVLVTDLVTRSTAEPGPPTCQCHLVDLDEVPTARTAVGGLSTNAHQTTTAPPTVGRVVALWEADEMARSHLGDAAARRGHALAFKLQRIGGCDRARAGGAYVAVQSGPRSSNRVAVAVAVTPLMSSDQRRLPFSAAECVPVNALDRGSWRVHRASTPSVDGMMRVVRRGLPPLPSALGQPAERPGLARR